MLKHYLYLLLVIYSWGLCAQGNGQANIFMDSTSFLIGDQVSMQLVVNVPAGTPFSFPTINDLLDKEKLELIDQQKSTLIQGDVNDTYQQTILLTAWEPGSYQIPELVFSYPKNKTTVEIKSAPLMLTVLAPEVTGDSTYVADIKTILAEEANFLDHLYSFFTHPVVLALLMLALAFLAFYVFTQRQKRSKAIVPKTAEEIALEQLAALEANNFLEQNKTKEYHTSISLILRTYINGRFKIKALERPTSEFMPKIKGHYLLKKSLYDEFKTVLEHADLIKYAKASPLDIANKKALSLCFELIHSIQAILEEEAKQVSN
ncbi:BatD family protein [Aureispira anguillae]|uniref:BatD family protein n=1 Tax=Aureispira anguillae TaxID=2864201 RepID=A0A915YKB0_9BACT|nr:BatD family protein [Aureispira anguillae]BDS14780.1 BatD family protein [Aureispira anguillae]